MHLPRCTQVLLSSHIVSVDEMAAAVVLVVVVVLTASVVAVEPQKWNLAGRYILHSSTIQKMKKPPMPMHMMKWKLVHCVFSVDLQIVNCWLLLDDATVAAAAAVVVVVVVGLARNG